MNSYLGIAGLLCIILGLIHSILGEYLIFHPKRKPRTLVPTQVESDVQEKHLRIIWATWHLASLFGFCIGALLIKLAIVSNQDFELLLFLITGSMILSGLLVLMATKGKHPGWFILLLIGTLIFFGM